MKRSVQSDRENFYRQLETYWATVKRNSDLLKNARSIGQSLIFEQRAQFYSTKLGVWDEPADKAKSDQTFERTRKAFAKLHFLIRQLISELSEENDPSNGWK